MITNFANKHHVVTMRYGSVVSLILLNFEVFLLLDPKIFPLVLLDHFDFLFLLGFFLFWAAV